MTDRAAFEAWRRRTTKMDPDGSVALEGFGDDAPYANGYTRAMWSAWQEAVRIERAACAAISLVRPKELNDVGELWADGYSAALADYADMIRSRTAVPAKE